MWPEEQKENKWARMRSPAEANSRFLALGSPQERYWGPSKVKPTLGEAEEVRAARATT